MNAHIVGPGCSAAQAEVQVWSLAALPDGSGFISGSADKYIRVWSWARVDTEDDNDADGGQGAAGRRLTISQDTAISTGQDVLCVRVSPDGNLVAASLVSNVIKVCYYEVPAVACPHNMFAAYEHSFGLSSFPALWHVLAGTLAMLLLV